MRRPNAIAFTIGAAIGLLLTLCYFTMGGEYFLGIPVPIIFWPGALCEKFVTRSLGLDEHWLGTIMLSFAISNAIGYGFIGVFIRWAQANRSSSLE